MVVFSNSSNLLLGFILLLLQETTTAESTNFEEYQIPGSPSAVPLQSILSPNPSLASAKNVTPPQPVTGLVTLIPGTTSLYTGVYYFLHSTFPEGEAYYLRGHLPSDPDNFLRLFPVVNENITKPEYADRAPIAQWTFAPAENGAYLLYNRDEARASFNPVVIYGNGFQVGLLTGSNGINDNYKKGGSLRQYASWYISIVDGDHIHLHCVIQNNNIFMRFCKNPHMDDPDDTNYNCDTDTQYLDIPNHYSWTFKYTPVHPVLMNVGVKNFQYEIPAEDVLNTFRVGTDTTFYSQSIDNTNGQAIVRQKIIKEIHHKSSFSYSNNFEFCAAVEVEIDVGIPLIAEGKTTLTAQFSAGDSRTWSHDTEEFISVQTECEVAANRCVLAHGYYTFVKDLALNFTATIFATGTTVGRLSGSNGGDVNITNAPGYYVQQQLSAVGYTGQITVQDSYVFGNISGTVICNGGVKTFETTRDCPSTNTTNNGR